MGALPTQSARYGVVEFPATCRKLPDAEEFFGHFRECPGEFEILQFYLGIGGGVKKRNTVGGRNPAPPGM